MATPTLYGTAASRALRSVWAIEEVGIDFEHVPTNFLEQSKASDYLAVNPNGRIPALVDGDLVLFESMAINLYLAKTYGGNLYPASPGLEAMTWQWSVWGISEIEPLQMQIVIQKLFVAEEKRSEKTIANAEKGLQRPLGVLENHLAGRPNLLGESFTIADLNLAGVMALMMSVDVDISAYGNVRKWLDVCYSRPSYARAQARD